MKYTILNEAVGEVGTEFVPDDGINVEALIEGGFIKSTSKATKSDKPITDTNEE